MLLIYRWHDNELPQILIGNTHSKKRPVSEPRLSNNSSLHAAISRCSLLFLVISMQETCGRATIRMSCVSCYHRLCDAVRQHYYKINENVTRFVTSSPTQVDASSGKLITYKICISLPIAIKPQLCCQNISLQVGFLL